MTASRQKYPEINQETWEWFTKKRATNNIITGPMIQEQARMIALSKGIADFEGSNGWLRTYTQRHSISQAILSGESADVREETVSDWVKRIPELVKGYE